MLQRTLVSSATEDSSIQYYRGFQYPVLQRIPVSSATEDSGIQCYGGFQYPVLQRIPVSIATDDSSIQYYRCAWDIITLEVGHMWVGQNDCRSVTQVVGTE